MEATKKEIWIEDKMIEKVMKKDLEVLTEIEMEATATTTLEIMMKSKEIMKKVSAFNVRNLDIL